MRKVFIAQLVILLMHYRGIEEIVCTMLQVQPQNSSQKNETLWCH